MRRAISSRSGPSHGAWRVATGYPPSFRGPEPGDQSAGATLEHEEIARERHAGDPIGGQGHPRRDERVPEVALPPQRARRQIEQRDHPEVVDDHHVVVVGGGFDRRFERRRHRRPPLHFARHQVARLDPGVAVAVADREHRRGRGGRREQRCTPRSAPPSAARRSRGRRRAPRACRSRASWRPPRPCCDRRVAPTRPSRGNCTDQRGSPVCASNAASVPALSPASAMSPASATEPTQFAIGCCHRRLPSARASAVTAPSPPTSTTSPPTAGCARTTWPTSTCQRS